MRFEKGNKAAVGRKTPEKPTAKTVWILQSLQEHGYDYEAMLVKFLSKAAQGDRHALDMAHLLVKLIPHLANAPKNDVSVNQIETLVINRFDSPVKTDAVETSATPLDIPSQTEKP